MAFVMGIVTMVRLSRSMPRKLSEAALYGGQLYYPNPMITGHAAQLPPPITSADYFSMMKRMAELEDKVSFLIGKPAVMPPEKEEMLNAALSRVCTLEEELSAAKKVHTYSLVILNSNPEEADEEHVFVTVPEF